MLAFCVGGELCHRFPAVVPRLLPRSIKVPEAGADLHPGTAQKLCRVDGALIVPQAGFPGDPVLCAEVDGIDAVFRGHCRDRQMAAAQLPIQLQQMGERMIKQVQLRCRAVQVDAVEGRALHFIQKLCERVAQIVVIHRCKFHTKISFTMTDGVCQKTTTPGRLSTSVCGSEGPGVAAFRRKMYMPNGGDRVRIRACPKRGQPRSSPQT